jgi:hypothetical protein
MEQLPSVATPGFHGRVKLFGVLALRFHLLRQEQLQILADGQRAWMIRTETALEYAEGAAAQGLGLRQAVRGLRYKITCPLTDRSVPCVRQLSCAR